MALIPVDYDPQFVDDPTAARRRGLMKFTDLDEVVPINTRRAGRYIRGVGTLPAAGGGDWDDLDLKRPMDGMKSDPALLQQHWDAAVARVKGWSPETDAVLTKYLADHPKVGPGSPEFWQRALS